MGCVADLENLSHEVQSSKYDDEEAGKQTPEQVSSLLGYCLSLVDCWKQEQKVEEYMLEATKVALPSLSAAMLVVA